jgi:oligogalacturonide lyase
MDYNGEEDIPKVGFIDKDCNILRELELPYYCNHYHANIDNTKLVADAVNDLVMIDISTDEPKIEVLVEHNTSWRYQASHPHPTFSWSNNAILYASDCDKEGEPQLYLIRL